MTAHLAWSNLMRLLDEVEQRHGYTQLDNTCKRLLEWISLRETNQPLYVRETISKSVDASPATIHKALTTLQSRGLLSANADPLDSRRRLLRLTPKAKTLLKAMAKDFGQGYKKIPQL